MKVHAKIQKWGNSLGLRITGPIKNIPAFKENMRVEVVIHKTGISIRKAAKRKKTLRDCLPFTEKTLLKGLTPHFAHSDEVDEFRYLPGELDV